MEPLKEMDNKKKILLSVMIVGFIVLLVIGGKTLLFPSSENNKTDSKSNYIDNPDYENNTSNRSRKRYKQYGNINYDQENFREANGRNNSKNKNGDGYTDVLDNNISDGSYKKDISMDPNRIREIEEKELVQEKEVVEEGKNNFQVQKGKDIIYNKEGSKNKSDSKSISLKENKEIEKPKIITPKRKENSFFFYSEDDIDSNNTDKKTSIKDKIHYYKIQVLNESNIIHNSTVRFLLLDDIDINNMFIPKLSVIYGQAQLSSDRFKFKVHHCKAPNKRDISLNQELLIYDLDYVEGIYSKKASERLTEDLIDDLQENMKTASEASAKKKEQTSEIEKYYGSSVSTADLLLNTLNSNVQKKKKLIDLNLYLKEGYPLLIGIKENINDKKGN